MNLNIVNIENILFDFLIDNIIIKLNNNYCLIVLVVILIKLNCKIYLEFCMKMI